MLVTILALLLRLAAVLGRSARLRHALLALALCLGLRAQARGHRRSVPPCVYARSRAKPAWVRQEIIRLKALMSHAGCRRIADSFNRRFSLKRKMTVGKTFVE